MATSPLFGWEEPDDTDLVKDGAAAIRTLGNAIDTSMGDLLGGTTGQVLSKASNTNMDFTWVAQDDSNAIQNAIVDAKGDLIAATAADTPARLAVGTDGQVLTADSTASTGLKWATAGGGSALTKITSATFTNVADTGTTFDGVFTNTYNNYLIVFSDIYGSYNADLRFRIKNSGGTVTSAYYGALMQNGTVTTISNAAQFKLMLLSTENASATMTFARNATPSQWSYYGMQRLSNNMVSGAGNNDTVGANAATGFILSADGGNIYGFVAVYGLAD